MFLRQPVDGGWNFAFNPDLDVRTFPAFWRSERASCIVVFDGAARFADLPAGLAQTFLPVAERRGERGTHLVLDRGRKRHRLRLIPASHITAEPGFRVTVGKGLLARLDAIRQLAIGVHGYNRNEPRAYQRFRLTMLLAILDSIDVATLQDIANGIVMPGSRRMRSAEWKASSERRRVQRLVNEARRMRDTGYLELLRGSN